MRMSVLVAVLCWLLPAAALAQSPHALPVNGGGGTEGVVGAGGTPGRAVHAPDLATRLELETRTRSHWRAGAITGFVLGAGATYLVLRSGGSTAPCDRAANQDAIGAKECAGLAVAGGLVGAVLGGLIGSQIRVGAPRP